MHGLRYAWRTNCALFKRLDKRNTTATTDDDTDLVYDGQNNVTSITVGATPTAKDEFWYDPDGQRFLGQETWQSSGTKTAITVYLGKFEEVIPASGGSYDLVQRTDLSDGVRHIRTRTTGGVYASRFEYVHRDHLGSVATVTDAAGALLNNKIPFDPFGGRRSQNWATDITTAELNTIRSNEDERWSRGFTDHEMLNRTGFIHMNGRVYDPRIGRFVSADPIVQSPFHSQSYNRYSYVFGSPLTYTDPTGFMGAGGAAADGYVGSAYGAEFDPSVVLGAAHGSDPFDHSKVTEWDFRPMGDITYFINKMSNRTELSRLYVDDKKGILTFQFTPVPMRLIPWRGTVVIHGTASAFAHYMYGSGERAVLDESLQQAIKDSADQKFREDRIITGKSDNMFEGVYAVDMEIESLDTYFIGKTDIFYSTTCDSSTCKTDFTSQGDGFWDAGDPLNFFEGDGMGSAYALPGGTPYPFVPFSWSIAFANPASSR